MKYWMLLLCCLLGLTLARNGLAGEPSAADKETARGLLDRGDALAQKKDLAGAVQAYRGAYAIVRVPTTGAALARTLRAMGKWVEAKAVADEVAAMAPKPGEPEVLTQSREEAAALAKELGPKIPRLTVLLRGVREGETAKVTVDGRELSRAEQSSGVALDPGRHELEASAGKARATERVELAEGEHRAFTLTLSQGKAGAARAPSSPKPAPGTSSSKRTLGFVIGGIGIAGLATAGVTGAMLLSRDAEIKDNCPDKRCNAKGRDLIDGSKPLITVNTVAWAVGVAGVGVGAYLVLTGKSDASAETAVGPSWVPGGATVNLVRGF